MQSLIRSKSAGVTGGRGTAGAGHGRDLLYHPKMAKKCQFLAEIGIFCVRGFPLAYIGGAGLKDDGLHANIAI